MRQAIRFIAVLAVAAFVSGCSSNGGGGSIPGSNGAGKSILSDRAGESNPMTSKAPVAPVCGYGKPVTPQSSGTRWGFEVHPNSWDLTSLANIKSTGVTFVRMDLAPDFVPQWNSSPPNWGIYDTFVMNALTNGLGILFVGPYLYTPTSAPSSQDITSPKQYVTFLQAAASHYAGCGIMYELGPNEPDLPHNGVLLRARQYATLYAIPAADAIRGLNDPTTHTISAGTYYFAFLWHAALAATGLQRHVDAIGTHAYLTLPALLHYDLDTLSQLYGDAKPIYITEFGSPYAPLLLNMMAAGKSSYVPLFNIYEYQDQSSTDDYGMLTVAASPRPVLSQVEQIINP